MRILMIVLIAVIVAGPLIYLIVFGPIGKGQVGPKDRDLSAWGNPDRDRVPGSRRRN